MSGSTAGVVIVGAGLGGIRVAENLRNNGYTCLLYTSDAADE